MELTFLEQLKESCSIVLENEPMSEHTTFKIGGPADFFAVPKDAESLAFGIRLCREKDVPYTILGNGSNMLVSDNGIEGVVFEITDAFSQVQTEGCLLSAGAGIRLTKLARAALDAGLSGFEFASGIPGTLGGGIYMNAGAYGREMKQVVRSVTYLNERGEVKRAVGEELTFGYRKSMFTNQKYVILSAELLLENGNREKIREEMIQLNEQRSSKQPLDMPSAGSVFKRPEGNFAGTLIENAGLKGFSVGGAEVSHKHAGFIVNRGNATAQDVLNLIEAIKNTVEKRFSIRLEEEVRLIGR